MRRTRAPIAQIFSVALLSAGLVACTDGDRPIIILQNQVPSSGCVISSSRSADFLPRGIIDTSSTQAYIFNPLVQNNALESTDMPNQRLVFVEGAEVNLSIQAGASASPDSSLLSFTSRFSGSIEPGGGTTSFSFPLIATGVLEAIEADLPNPTDRVQVTADITIFGSMGGGSVESIPFTYPVEVCNGCMEVSVGLCAELADGFTPLTGGECNPKQDVITECCTAGDGSLVCPAAPPVEGV